MIEYGPLALYCAGIVGASLGGGFLPIFLHFGHRKLQLALSFVAGVMLGVALFHMLPHAVLESIEAHEAAEHAASAIATAAAPFDHGDFDKLSLAMVAGFLAMFLLERFAPYHRHEADAAHDECDHEPGHAGGHAGGHRGGHGHSHAHAGGEAPRLAWLGALLGMGLHALLEGVALAASMLATTEHGGGKLAGFGTFLVIVLHKPFDSMTLGTLFKASRGGNGALHLLNAGFALVVPLGAVLFLLGADPSRTHPDVVPIALAFSAGTFLCIATSDLLPELQFHRHDRVALSISLILGLAVAWSIGLLESSAHPH